MAATTTPWLNGVAQKLALAGVLQSKISNVWNLIGVTANFNQSTGYWDITFSGGGGSGDVVGPASSVDNRLALFSGATGKLLKLAPVLVSDLLLKSGAVAMTGDLDLGTHKASNAADGSAGTDLATVGQMTTAIAAAASTVADWKQSVRAATTAALPANTRVSNVLTANANGALAAQDGVTLIVGDRFLVKDEATGANRGIYTVTTVGSGGAPWSLTRATDADASSEVTCGLTCLIEEGAIAGGKPYILTTANPITINATALTFTQLSSATAGNGLTGSGALAVLPNGTTLTVGASGVKLRDAVAAGHEMLWDGSQWLLIGRLTGTALTDANATLQFTTAPQYIWPAAVDATVTRALTLGTTGLAAAPMAGVGAIVNIFFLKASYSNAIAVVNGGAGAGTIFTLPASLGKPVAASFYYDGANWALAGWEYLSTPAAA